MSQRSVETVIGRLVTDEALRARFALAPAETLGELSARELDLTPTEIAAIAATGPRLFERLAAGIDPRLVKADLRRRRST
jgi:hypothetical protein